MDGARHNTLLDSLPVSVSEGIEYLYTGLDRAGFECYLVGGLIRDLVLQRTPVNYDVDIATNAHPEEVRRIFRHTIPTGIKHGTITVLFKGRPFEVTTYRSDGLYSNGRHPDSVRFAATLSEDLSRRDFTINALAYEPRKKLLIDEHGGREDLRLGVVRCIGAATDRFFEDGLRPIRACRFCSVLAFSLHPDTEKAISLPAVMERTALVSIERVSDELWKGLEAREVSRMLIPLHESGIMNLFFPDEEATNISCSTHRLKELDMLFPAPAVQRMAAWWRLLGIAEERLVSLGRRFKFSSRNIRDIRMHYRLADHLESLPRRQDPEHARRIFLSELKNVYGQEGEFFLKESTIAPEGVDEKERLLAIFRNSPLIITDLAVSGEDLLKWGLRGREVGQLLSLLLKRVLREPAENRREILLEMIREHGNPGH